ncbi:MAG: LytTR family DNA-binding domain-containing protein [Allomuricauda sp.]
MKTKNFLTLIVIIALLLGLLIYWREYETRDQVSVLHVLLWQLAIWIPWVIGFKVLGMVVEGANTLKNGKLRVFGFGCFWVVFHYGWFFWLSSHYSPYLDLPGSRFGVYSYFFIFWTLIDIGLLLFVIDKLRGREGQSSPIQLRFELTRGAKKYFCEPSEIYWLVAENYYTKLSTASGIFVMRKPLKSFHDVLPPEMFQKIHRSTIINVDYVSGLSGNTSQGLEVVLKDGTRRKVSRSFAKEILHFFKDRSY